MALAVAVSTQQDQFQLGVHFKAKDFWTAIHFEFDAAPLSKCIWGYEVVVVREGDNGTSTHVDYYVADLASLFLLA